MTTLNVGDRVRFTREATVDQITAYNVWLDNDLHALLQEKWDFEVLEPAPKPLPLIGDTIAVGDVETLGRLPKGTVLKFSEDGPLPEVIWRDSRGWVYPGVESFFASEDVSWSSFIVLCLPAPK